MAHDIKKDLKIAEKSARKFGQDFKSFISKGNVLDLAVGVIIGAAFGKIVSSLVSDILMPLIGVLSGGVNLAGLSVKVGYADLTYGSFLQNILDFFIIAFCIFILIRIIHKLTPKTPPAPVKDSKAEQLAKEQNALLTEIRDFLKKGK